MLSLRSQHRQSPCWGRKPLLFVALVIEIILDHSTPYPQAGRGQDQSIGEREHDLSAHNATSLATCSVLAIACW